MQTRSVRPFAAIVALIGLAMTAVTISPAPAAADEPVVIEPDAIYEQDFSADAGDWTGATHDSGSGTATVSADSTSYYGGLTGPSEVAYRSTWPEHGVVSELDVYLDPEAMAVGDGFDLSVGISSSSGGHRRDFIFHVGKVAGSNPSLPGEDDAVLVNASNNTNGTVSASNLLNATGGSYATVSEAGWYTLQHSFRIDAGALAVDLKLLDADGDVVFTKTRSNPGDVQAILGGVRYQWFPVMVGAFAIDNQRLSHNTPYLVRPTLQYEQDFSESATDWSAITHNAGPGTGTVSAPSYSYFGGLASGAEYRSTWPEHGVVSELDVYLDPEAMAVGNGFDLTVGISDASGEYRRDFIFHVGKVSGANPSLPGSDDQVLVNASNNTDNVVNPSKLLNLTGGPYAIVSAAGWYTFQHSFRVEDGALAVDLNLLDAAGDVVFTKTRRNPADVEANLGNVRYQWFPALNGSFAIDNQRLFHNELVPLGPGALGGVVSSEGSPVAGARVRYYKADSSVVLGSAYTAGDGSYSIEDLEPGDYKVRVTADGYVGQFWAGQSSFAKADVVHIPASATVDVGFALEAIPTTGTVSGTVTGGGDGVAGALVRLYDSSAKVVASTLTGGDGSYAFDVAAGEYKLLVIDSSGDWVSPRWVGGTSFSTAATQSVTAGGTTGAGTVELLSTAALRTISGAIVEGGSPAANLRVTLYSPAAEILATVFSAPDGSYSFGDLPAGTYFVRVRESGSYKEAWWDGAVKWKDATPIVLGSSATGVDISVVSLSAPPPALTLTSASAGGSHSCGVTASGGVQCWGSNASGQLGDGTATTRLSPVTVAGLSDVVDVDAGSAHTCAVLGDGGVRCWGSNASGQLGDGSTDDSSTPVAVDGITDAVAVSASTAHTCAVLDSGGIACWGNNGKGRLGDGSTDDSSTPVTVDGISGAVAVSAGAAHTCALLDDEGVSCWGDNGSGRLGDGTTTNRLTPVGVDDISATSISAGGSHTCAVLTDGTARCWGLNGLGRLGDGSTDPRSTPVAVAGLSDVVSITAGNQHTCAVLDGGSARCWGNGGNGRLGDGTATSSSTPLTVSGAYTWSSLSAGDAHTCGVTAGAVRCWGNNSSGRLGDGTSTQRSTP